MDQNRLTSGGRVSKSRAGRGARSHKFKDHVQRLLYHTSMLLSDHTEMEYESEQPEAETGTLTDPDQDTGTYFEGPCPYTGCLAQMDATAPVQSHFSKHVACQECCPKCCHLCTTVQEFMSHTELCLRYCFNDVLLTIKEGKRHRLSRRVLEEFFGAIHSGMSVVSGPPNEHPENVRPSIEHPGIVVESPGIVVENPDIEMKHPKPVVEHPHSVVKLNRITNKPRMASRLEGWEAQLEASGITPQTPSPKMSEQDTVLLPIPSAGADGWLSSPLRSMELQRQAQLLETNDDKDME